jgi:exodeoxyribonuclease V beta subunit
LRGYIDLVLVHDERYSWWTTRQTIWAITPRLRAGRARSSHAARPVLSPVPPVRAGLHRYLGQRLRGYDFERHFGGVYYLFIKGMGPELGQSGVFFEKPPLARLTGLSRLLEQAT